MVKLLVIRNRVGTETFGYPEDASGLKYFLPLFKTLFFTNVKVLQADGDLDRLNAVDHNNSTNEPILLLSAFAWGYLAHGNPASYAVTLLYGCVAARFAHTLMFITQSSPFRTFAYVPALAGNIFMSVLALLSKK